MKILIIETTIINFGDDRGGQVCESPSFQDVNKDTAKTVVASGRALYTAKADDPEKGAPNTAPAEMIKAAEAEIARIAKAAKAESAPAPAPAE